MKIATYQAYTVIRMRARCCVLVAGVKPPTLTAYEVHHASERREFLREVAPLRSDS
jgi:hypothetical protein